MLRAKVRIEDLERRKPTRRVKMVDEKEWDLFAPKMKEDKSEGEQEDLGEDKGEEENDR